MAKKPGPVAGSLGNTDYYYKSDGTVVDENGIPASARIAAMFTAPPPAEEVAAVKAVPKRKKKNNAQIAGVLKNTKYYYAPDGSIIDDRGLPAPEKIAAYFPPHEKREAIAEAMPKAPGIKAQAKPTGVPSKVIKQFNKNVSIATNLITTNQKIMESYPKLFEQMSSVVQKMTEQNEAVIRTMIQNNQEFQDKVIETLTGVKAPTQAGGSVAPKPGRKGAGRKTAQKTRSAAVLARAQRMKQAKATSNRNLGIGLAVAGTAVAVGAALIATSPSGVGGGGSGSSGEAPPGGMWPNTPASGNNRQILETIKKRESGGNYNAQAKGSSASGAYQFIDSTWRSRAQAAGVDIRQYPRAVNAPPDVQDKVADAYISEILRKNNNDVSKVPLVWYTGNAQGQMSAAALAVNRGLTPQAYQASWMKTYQQMGGSVAATQPSTPPAPAPAPVPAGGPERRPSATPEEASQHTANINELKSINDLLAKKGQGARLGEANAARKAELEQKIKDFQQKYSIRPIQQAGVVRPLDTTGMPSQEKVQQDLASLGNADLQKYNTKDQSHIAGLQPNFAGRLGQFLAAAEQAGAPIKIMSGYRSPERQAQLFQAAVAKYGSPEAARKWVAPPGRSNHGRGIAVDLQYSSGQAQAWAHQNASKFGLYFRMSHEPWHIEPQGSASDSDFTPGAPAPDYYASNPGSGRSQMTTASEGYAINRACACPPMDMAIINRTVTNDIRTNIFQQMAGPTYRPEAMMSPFMIGATIGSALRRLF